MPQSESTHNKRLKILFVPRWYPSHVDPQNGIFIKKHAQAVSILAEVAVLHIQIDPNLKESYSVSVSDKGITEILVYFRQDTSMFRKLINTYRYFRATVIAYKQLSRQEFSPDICHIHVLTRTSILALYLKVFKKVPFLVTEHWTGYASGMYDNWSRIKKTFHRYILQKSSFITTVSESLRKKLVAISGREVEVIPNVVDSTFNYVAPRTGDRIRILTVADLYDKKKNISDVIRTVGEIYQIDQNIEYHIIGDGEDRKLLEELAGDCISHEGVIHFHGGQPNTYVAEFLPQVDFVIVNSNFETFCVIAIEALATGKPVIVTRSGGPEEFITEEFGIVIPKGDRKALKEAILAMLKSYRAYDGKKMSSFVKEGYSPEKVGSQFYSLYQQMLSK